LKLGARWLSLSGALYFVTLTPSSEHEQKAWRGALRKLLDAWRDKARRHGVKLVYAYADGYTNAAGLHTHLLINWIPPDATPSPTPTRQQRMSSAWLAERAAPLGIAIHTELANDADKVAAYLESNASGALDEHHEHADYYRPLVFSRGWLAVPRHVESADTVTASNATNDTVTPSNDTGGAAGHDGAVLASPTVLTHTFTPVPPIAVIISSSGACRGSATNAHGATDYSETPNDTRESDYDAAVGGKFSFTFAEQRQRSSWYRVREPP
jgi:hypothetical protein